MTSPVSYMLVFLAATVGTFLLALLSYWILKSIVFQGVRSGRGQLQMPFRVVRRWGITLVVGFSLPLFLLLGWLTGRPFFGLGGLIFLPFLIKGLLVLLNLRLRGEVEKSALVFLWGLRGLLQVGVSFPLALFRLSRGQVAIFSRILQPYLERYEEGKPLTHCLERFLDKVPIGRARYCFLLLLISYQKGFSMGPLLERMIPFLERQCRAAERERSIRRGVLVQALFAVMVPWALGAFLGWLQPNVMVHFIDSTYCIPLVGIATVLQLIGGGCLWRFSRYC